MIGNSVSFQFVCVLLWCVVITTPHFFVWGRILQSTSIRQLQDKLRANVDYVVQRFLKSLSTELVKLWQQLMKTVQNATPTVSCTLVGAGVVCVHFVHLAALRYFCM